MLKSLLFFSVLSLAFSASADPFISFVKRGEKLAFARASYEHPVGWFLDLRKNGEFKYGGELKDDLCRGDDGKFYAEMAMDRTGMDEPGWVFYAEISISSETSDEVTVPAKFIDWNQDASTEGSAMLSKSLYENYLQSVVTKRTKRGFNGIGNCSWSIKDR